MKKYFLFLIFALSSLFTIAQSAQYLHFDRMDDYVRTENGSDLVLGINQMSMAGWFYTDELAYGQGMIGFRGSNNGFYLIQLADGVLECRLQTNTGLHQFLAPAFTIQAEVWQHVAWVYDGNTVKLYIDGVLTGQSGASGTISDAGIPFTIGRSILSNLSFYFGGRADEVSLWSKALTVAEIEDMMDNELIGDENNLELYYKFNQGVPGGNNSTITTLEDETGTMDGQLFGFSLNGYESNFDGEFDNTFQAITFPTIPNKLVTDQVFSLAATSSVGLPVSYSVVSGPATLSGDSVYLNGVAGTVVIEANQAGDSYYQAAAPVQVSFEVLNPADVTPNIELTNPYNGDVVVPELAAIQLAAIVDIPYNALFNVQVVEFEIDGTVYQAKHWKDGHYTSYWQPDDYGTHTVNIRAYNNFGYSNTISQNVNIVQASSNQSVNAFSGIVINSSISSENTIGELPNFLGAYSHVTATLDINCPPNEPCGEWDHLARVMLKTHEGEWVEFIKYVTPYGKACVHTADVSDFISALQGKIEFRVECTTFDTGYEYNLTLDYAAGTPDFKYSLINKMWHGAYDFGNPDNLQPAEPYDFTFPEFTDSAVLKLVASGHGWGDNNTANAAEFHEDTHHILVNDLVAFTQNNWNICDPNPDGCQPQFGTWYFPRAGWCPGSIAPFFNYDFSSFLAQETVNIKYRFDEDYVDNCHPNNPNCVSGVTCPNCDDGFNPHLIVASAMVTFSNTAPSIATGSVNTIENESLDFSLFPNPANDFVLLSLNENIEVNSITISNIAGKIVQEIVRPNFSGSNLKLNLKHMKNGIYFITLKDKNNSQQTLSLVVNN